MFRGEERKPARDPTASSYRRRRGGSRCFPSADAISAARRLRGAAVRGRDGPRSDRRHRAWRRCCGASIGTSLLNTIFAAVTSYLTAHLAAARLIGRQALTGLALAHGYDTAFWWTAGIFAAGAVVSGTLLRRGPLRQVRGPSPAYERVATAPAEPAPEQPR
jgi:hypothetical protein